MSSSIRMMSAFRIKILLANFLHTLSPLYSYRKQLPITVVDTDNGAMASLASVAHAFVAGQASDARDSRQTHKIFARRCEPVHMLAT